MRRSKKIEYETLAKFHREYEIKHKVMAEFYEGKLKGGVPLKDDKK